MMSFVEELGRGRSWLKRRERLVVWEVVDEKKI
jgi:hypothetical protein